MNLERSFQEQLKLSKKIPLHYQRRYLANLSNGSFNASFITGIYRNKIKSLLQNNRTLAQSLQNERAEKEELLKENIANAYIIMFSMQKLSNLSINAKKEATIVKETMTLLQKHTSVTSTDLLPRNVRSKEKFKEQVYSTAMDCVPEEPDLPNRKKSVWDRAVKKIHSYNSQVSEEKCEPAVTSNSTSNCDYLIEKLTINPVKENEKDPELISHGVIRNKINCGNRSSVKTVTPRRQGKLISKNETFLSEAGNKKVVPKLKECKSSKNASRNNNIIPSTKNHLVLNAPYLDKIEPSFSKICGSDNKKAKSMSDLGKENKENEIQIQSTKKFKNLIEPSKTTTKKGNSKSLPLKNSMNSPKINSINKDNIKANVCEKNLISKRKKAQLDDITVSKGKNITVELNRVNENHTIFDSSKSYLQDITSQLEMVKNLAENTYLVTAEIHHSPERIEQEKNKGQNIKDIQQPYVLLQDIFHSPKSFCKSISSEKYNENSLKLKLLGHCSSLKMIPENSGQDSSSSMVNSSVENQDSKTSSASIEPSLSVERVIFEEPQIEEKRNFRKRTSIINYKEVPRNIKMRR